MHTRHLRTRNHPARAVTEKYKTDHIPLIATPGPYRFLRALPDNPNGT